MSLQIFVFIFCPNFIFWVLLNSVKSPYDQMLIDLVYVRTDRKIFGPWSAHHKFRSNIFPSGPSDPPTQSISIHYDSDYNTDLVASESLPLARWSARTCENYLIFHKEKQLSLNAEQVRSKNVDSTFRIHDLPNKRVRGLGVWMLNFHSVGPISPRWKGGRICLCKLPNK